MERFTKNELERFNSKWIKEGECMLWQGPLDRDGYGTFYFKKKGRRAHRVSYYMHVGEIPREKVVDHTCSKRNCVNPFHLRLLTATENTMISKAQITHCKLGHPFDRFYGKQRYCSICQREKSKRLRAKWLEEANKVLC